MLPMLIPIEIGDPGGGTQTYGVSAINRLIGLCDEATDRISLSPPLGKVEMTLFPAKFGVPRLIYEISSGSDITRTCIVFCFIFRVHKPGRFYTATRREVLRCIG